MSNSISITLADGRHASITGVPPAAGGQASLSFQLFDVAGQPLGGPQLLVQTHGFDGRFIAATAIDTQTFAVTPLSNGGFEVVFNGSEGDSQGFVRQVLVGIGVDAQGHVIADTSGADQNGFLPGNFRLTLDAGGERLSGATPIAPQLHELEGGRFAVSYETFDALRTPTAHVGLGGLGGLYADATVVSPPDVITHTNGDIALIWNQGGSTFREVLGEDGAVVSPRAETHVFTLSIGGATVVNGFDPADDQLVVVGADGALAGGPVSTLTFDARDHGLTWDQDSEGPVQPVRIGTLGVDGIGIANLADGFRPEVLKVIAADGSETITWFDSDHSQAWDTLLAVKTAQGELATYGSILDDGTRTTFHFDVDGSQPWQRYVDQQDAAGHVLQRTVLVDNGQSWTAIFTFSGGQVVSYEVDSFDVNGQQVGRGFFHADGTPI